MYRFITIKSNAINASLSIAPPPESMFCHSPVGAAVIVVLPNLGLVQTGLLIATNNPRYVDIDISIIKKFCQNSRFTATIICLGHRQEIGVAGAAD